MNVKYVSENPHMRRNHQKPTSFSFIAFDLAGQTNSIYFYTNAYKARSGALFHSVLISGKNKWRRRENNKI